MTKPKINLGELAFTAEEIVKEDDAKQFLARSIAAANEKLDQLARGDSDE